MSSVEKFLENPLIEYDHKIVCGLKYDPDLSKKDIYILMAIKYHSKGIPTLFDHEYLKVVGVCSIREVGVSIRKLFKKGYIKAENDSLRSKKIYSTEKIISEVSEVYRQVYIKVLREDYLLKHREKANVFLLTIQHNRKEEMKNKSNLENKKSEKTDSRIGKNGNESPKKPILESENSDNPRKSKFRESAAQAVLKESENSVSYKESFNNPRENKENIIPKGIIVSSKDETKSDFGKSHPKSNFDSPNLEKKIETSLPSKNINTDSDNNIETSPLRKTKQTSFIDYDNDPAADEEYIDYYELDRNIDDPDEVFHDRDYTEEEEEELNRIDWDEVFPNGHPNNNIPSKEEFKSASEEENKDCGPDPILLEKNRLMLEEGITARAAAGDWEQVTNLNRAYISLYKTEFIPSDADIQNFLNPKKEEKEKERKKKGGLVLSEDKETRRERMKKAVNSEAAKQCFQLNREAEYVIANWERVGFPAVKDKNRDYTLELIKKFLEGKFSGIIPSYRGKKEDREYSYHEIIAGIQNRKLKAFDSGYYPGEDMKKKMRKMTLSAWLFIPGKEKDPSTFLKDFYIPPKKVTSSFGLIDDVNPAFTNLVKQIYAKEVLGNIPAKWNETDEGKFRLATKRFEEFKKDNRNRLDDFILYPPTQEKVARLFVKSAAYAVDGDYSKLNIGWLCTDKHFNERLPKFLNDKGLLKAI